jgi:hypothetical protein
MVGARSETCSYFLRVMAVRSGRDRRALVTAHDGGRNTCARAVRDEVSEHAFERVLHGLMALMSHGPMLAAQWT